MKIAILGATGDMGYGLALRLAQKGHDIIIGSRQEEKAEIAAEKARAEAGVSNISGLANPEAAKSGELVVISVPTAGHRALLEELKAALAEKPVLDITIPFAFKPLRYAPPSEGSNALETKAILGENSRVAAGFHTISASLLSDISHPLSGDTLVVGDDAETVNTVVELAKSIGLNAYHAGSLVFSGVVESLTPMLIGMNKRYGNNPLGITITGF